MTSGSASAVAARTTLAKPVARRLSFTSPVPIRSEHGGTRGGISPHLNLASYLRLLDDSGRLLRAGKACVH
ncbi:MAG: hypothetical protein R3C59_14960 [Planctomycetaceae bacterium]